MKARMNRFRHWPWLLLCLLTACATAPRIQNVPSVGGGVTVDRSWAISSYLSEQTLDPVEGIWIWDNSKYEVAVVKNDLGIEPEYQYLGFITDTQSGNWQRGEVKLLLKETASSGILSGIYLMGDKTRRGTTFILSNPNLIEVYLPTGPYGSQEKTLLIRVYPKAQGSEVARDQSEAHTGTGFFVAPQVVATNYHIVADAKTISVRVAGSWIRGELLLKDSQNDLALIKLTVDDNPLVKSTLEASVKYPLLGDPDAAQSGDRVYALGFPLSGVLGTSVSVSEGLIGNTVGLQDDPRMFQISVPIQPGSSGSPLFDSRGRVVGVITSTLNNRYLFATQGVIPQNVNFAVKTSYLQSMLALVPGWPGLTSAGLPTTILTPSQLKEKFSSAVVPIEARR